VLKVELPWLQNLHRPKRPRRLRVVLTVEKVTAVLARTWARSWPARVRRGCAIARTTWPAIITDRTMGVREPQAGYATCPWTRSRLRAPAS